MKIKNIIVSWDTLCSLIIAMIFYFLSSNEIPAENAIKIFEISITVLALFFSVFFAGLAVLITAGDDDFITFLQETNTYRRIINFFKYTMVVIFIALMVSVSLYVITIPITNTKIFYYFPKTIISIHIFIASYALFCSLLSVFDAIKYAERRAQFIKNNTDLEKLKKGIVTSNIETIKEMKGKDDSISTKRPRIKSSIRK